MTAKRRNPRIVWFRRIDAPRDGLSRKRIATLKRALSILPPLREKLHHAEERVWLSKQPMKTARGILKDFQRNAVTVAGRLDLSDVQELRPDLVRSRGALYNSDAQAFLLRRMEKQIVGGELSKKRFSIFATILKTLK